MPVSTWVHTRMCICVYCASVCMRVCVCVCVCLCVCELSGRSGKHSLSLSLVSHTQPVLIGSWSKIGVFLGFSSQPHSHPLLSSCPHCPLLSPLPAGEGGHALGSVT